MTPSPCAGGWHPWLVATHPGTALLLCPCLSSLLSLIRVLVIRFRAHWVILDDLITRSLIASTNTLFPNKVTCPGPGVRTATLSLGRLPFNPLQPPWVARQGNWEQGDIIEPLWTNPEACLLQDFRLRNSINPPYCFQPTGHDFPASLAAERALADTCVHLESCMPQWDAGERSQWLEFSSGLHC